MRVAEMIPERWLVPSQKKLRKNLGIALTMPAERHRRYFSKMKRHAQGKVSNKESMGHPPYSELV